MRIDCNLPAVLILLIPLASCGTSEPSAGIAPTPVVRTSAGGDSVTVIPGPEYSAGAFYRFWFGDHHRDLWTEPTTVPVLNLAEFAGGLEPVEAGGGFQTKSLRFRGTDGRFYKFRSTNKDPKAVLPLELRETVAADLAQDHISTSHPCAALVVDALAGFVGVPQLHPILVYLPESELLGTFNHDFGGLLGILELYPEADEEGMADFLGARKIRNTLKMFRAMEEESDDRPDQYRFLNARFLDLLVGDWDRHVKQWKWAEFKEEDRTFWAPIAMDRDQAMVRLDGLLPSVAAMSITQFTDFTNGVPDIGKLTFSGRFLDRRLLVGINRAEWDSAATVFIGSLTDDRLEAAVNRLPPEYRRLDGDRILSILKDRRDSFHATAREFYELVSEYVDVYLSDKREYVQIERLPDGNVELTAWRRRKGEDGPDISRMVFHRTFHAEETDEIRIYTLGGDDIIRVNGVVSTSILVRVVGGKGDDEFHDESVVEGFLWGFVPFTSSPETATYFYDHQGDNLFSCSGSTSVDTTPYRNPPGGIAQY